jgi:hypothetical protein
MTISGLIFCRTRTSKAGEVGANGAEAGGARGRGSLRITPGRMRKNLRAIRETNGYANMFAVVEDYVVLHIGRDRWCRKKLLHHPNKVRTGV